jgi:hypothetical protein
MPTRRHVFQESCRGMLSMNHTDAWYIVQLYSDTVTVYTSYLHVVPSGAVHRPAQLLALAPRVRATIALLEKRALVEVRVALRAELRPERLRHRRAAAQRRGRVA